MPKTALDAPQVISMLQEVCQAIIAAEPLLTDADRALGDGDHGLGMQRGMTAALEKLGALDPESTGIDNRSLPIPNRSGSRRVVTTSSNQSDWGINTN